MTDQPVTLRENDTLDQAFRKMVDEDVHRAPVTDDGRRVSGMLAQSDAVREGEGRRVGDQPQ